MRLDKYLKVSRLIKRREAAKEFVDKGYVRLNGKVAKPSTEVKVDDLIEITTPLGKTLKAKIKEIRSISTMDDASQMYEIQD
ncbi:MAG: RNA-binding S4 domain-containing protein [Bacilli bacterium]|jgi:ribosomal 50S subunit-recycling heat shock protein|nr:RNA-binding S4 domain-containing protein [Bacilli bacterium]